MLMRLRDTRPSDATIADANQRLAPLAQERARLTRRAQALLAAAGQSGPAARWYVLTIEPGADIPVDNALGNAGIERWMAAMPVKPKRRGGRKFQTFCSLVRPALPGYIFVRAAWVDETAVAMRSIDGVADAIGGWTRPSPLRDKEVEGLRVRAENDPEFIARLVNALKVGEVVRIDEGPFASFEGIVTALLVEAGRVKVEAGIFGRATPVELDIAQVSKSV